MENVLGNIYCWFERLFGLNLAEHLWGYDGEDYTGAIVFNTVGVITMIISLLIVLTYYYVINHPRFASFWSWMIVLLVNGIVNFFVAYSWVKNDLLDGVIADSLMYKRDENGEISSTLIQDGHCLGFGFANFIVASLFFILFTFSFKWMSRNCKYSPC